MNVQWMLESRGIFSDIPPDARTKEQNNPTLLVSWWATAFSVAIIVVRVCGRYIRTERFFREDKVMMASIIPLLIRMACVHVVLIWGTNNTKTVGLSAEDIDHRVIGSKFVLVARIFYAIFIWIAKFTVCEFLKRVAGKIWRRSLRIFLKFIYYFLASTLLAVIIATLAECQPFDHYWQVVPDPGPKCRLGYANLITMGSCDVMTDLLLVSFPIPFIVMTHMPLKRKVSLVILFALSLILVGITCYRVPSVIWNDGSQQYRSLVASLEILAATAVSNAVIIGSFVRDRGAKKNKFKKAQGSASVSESMDHSSVRRQTITHHQWGSDSDLAADLGIRLDPSLCSADTKTPRPAPIAMPIHPLTARAGTLDPNWSFNQRSGGSEDDRASSTGSLDIKVSPHEYIETNKTPRKSSSTDTTNLRIFDVGSLLNNPTPTSPTSAPTPQYSRYASRASNASTQDIGGSARTLHLNTTSSSILSHQLPLPSSPSFSRPGGLRSNSHSSSNRRRGSSVHFSDPPESPVPSYRSRADVSAPIIEGNEVELQDVGRLLSRR
ncbi:putative integral membrane protein Pth11-like [Aspergillus neoniger CBS 115656]|uniref:Integral membrane protein Pth11-like protein n=1 Tax=Aspergillus neoniger (strain CBS 115656) TaxID=1448310 RepID=A0A318YYD8_ASPNB|nr:integral membrane protein Pth11-like protein [Aspergillus neoniger CBS 115656]PYH39676.1 integral membrane protein Pth11-like protein [Aspergillus neoniger CBS 115656]